MQAVAPVILANTRHQVVLSASSLIIESVMGVQLDTIVMVPQVVECSVAKAPGAMGGNLHVHCVSLANMPMLKASLITC